MKEVNNFKLISSNLDFNSEDDFYFLQVIKRPKDGNNCRGNNKNRLIKYYLIKSIEQLLSYESEIINLCKMYNARAYIHPTKRSFEDVARKYCLNVTENVINKHYHLSGKEYSTACGQVYNTKDKLYIVDIDVPLNRTHNEMLLFIERECEPIGNKLKFIVPTLSGAHLIVSPFNVKKFTDKFPNIDIHKNNPTLLYYFKR